MNEDGEQLRSRILVEAEGAAESCRRGSATGIGAYEMGERRMLNWLRRRCLLASNRGGQAGVRAVGLDWQR